MSVAPSSASPEEVFCDHIDDLSDVVGASANFDRVVNKLVSKRLIDLSLVDDLTSTTSYSSYQRGSKVIRELYRQIRLSQRPRDVLIVICDVLISQNDPQLREIGQNMKSQW